MESVGSAPSPSVLPPSSVASPLPAAALAPLPLFPEDEEEDGGGAGGGGSGALPPSRDPNVAIHMRNVSKTYLLGVEGVPALRGVSLSVARGEFVVILGKSGGGKTTMLNIMGTIDRPTRGDLFISGARIDDATPDSVLADIRLQRLGFVFQTFNLLPTLTALENVELPMILAGRGSAASRRKRALRLLARVGLRERSGHYPGMMSGGEQQRTTIARALANEPDILLLDEPTGDLDGVNSAIILSILLGLNRRERVTCIMVTHDVSLKSYAHRVIHMVDGRIARLEQVPDVVRADADEALAAHPAVRAMHSMHAAARFESRVEKRMLAGLAPDSAAAAAAGASKNRPRSREGGGGLGGGERVAGADGVLVDMTRSPPALSNASLSLNSSGPASASSSDEAGRAGLGGLWGGDVDSEDDSSSDDEEDGGERKTGRGESSSGGVWGWIRSFFGGPSSGPSPTQAQPPLAAAQRAGGAAAPPTAASSAATAAAAGSDLDSPAPSNNARADGFRTLKSPTSSMSSRAPPSSSASLSTPTQATRGGLSGVASISHSIFSSFALARTGADFNGEGIAEGAASAEAAAASDATAAPRSVVRPASSYAPVAFAAKFRVEKERERVECEEAAAIKEQALRAAIIARQTARRGGGETGGGR